MKIILEWDGDEADLLDEDNGMSLVDNIIYTMRGLDYDLVLYHNDIRITGEK